MMMNIEQAMNWIIDHRGTVLFQPYGATHAESQHNTRISVTVEHEGELIVRDYFLNTKERKYTDIPIVSECIIRCTEEIRNRVEGEGWRRTHAPKSTL